MSPQSLRDQHQTTNPRTQPTDGADPVEFFCGMGAASINICITFPMNKLMFRQQLYGISARAAVKQLQKEGLSKLYRGMLPPLVQKTTSLSIMFGMYDKYQKVLRTHKPSASNTGIKATSAVLAGCTEAILCPLERVQVLLQDKHYHKHFRNTVHALSELRSYGAQEYYRGLTPILMRNGPSNVLFFLGRGEIKQLLPPASTQSGEIMRDFVSGGVLGAFISTLFFPVNVVKAQMQSRVGGEFIGFRAAFVAVFEERNRKWSNLFRGMHVNYTRSLISWGIINASYELLKKYLTD